MAKSKSKNDIKIANIKKSAKVVKKGANVVLLENKPVVNKNKKINIANTPEEKKNVTKNDIERRKERNRRKYQNQQRKYSNNRVNPRKKIVTEKEDIKEKKAETNEETLVKKNSFVPRKKNLKKIEERREKRKTNAFTKTIVNIKTISTDTINSVKEKTNDKNIPVGTTKNEKKQRFQRVIKEAVIYAVILTIINVLLATILDDVNFLRLFDLKIFNVLVTIIISLIFNLFIAFAVDYIVTTLWLKIKRKKSGDTNGNNGVNEGEYKEDISNQEGE